MTLPELVIVPARPGAGDACPVQFEVRVRADGRAVLPVFSSVAALVGALGRYQPWVCVPLRTAREPAARAGLAQVILDPEVTPSSLRWTASSLEASAQDRILDE